MKIDYTKLSLSQEDWQIIHDSIENNPFIPIKPYPKQLYAICDKSKRKLIGGSAYSGKSILGAVLGLQHFKAKNYRCLILRSTYDNVTATGGIVDYINEWTSEFPNVEHNQSKRVFINHDSNAKIYYSYMNLIKDKEKFKSRAYHRIIVDEASELYKVNLQFLNRSLRGTKGLMNFPLAIYYISNPADDTIVDGTQYLREYFVNGPFPYFEMNFWDNPYIDKYDYLESLRQLSKADYQFQIGNWDYEIKAGDVFDHDMIDTHTISKQEYDELLTEWELLQQVITWDIAATEKKTSDYTAYSLDTVFKNKIGAVYNQDSTKKSPGKLENYMMRIMDKHYDHENWIEQQPAAAGKIVKNYWQGVFKDYHPKFIPVPKSKLIRASRMVQGMNKGKILFVKGKWLKMFKKQAVKFPTEKVIANDESTHDDRVDSVTLLHEGLYPQISGAVLRKRKRWQ